MAGVPMYCWTKDFESKDNEKNIHLWQHSIFKKKKRKKKEKEKKADS